MKKYVAEFLGTAVLVLIGCGSVVFSGSSSETGIGFLGISLAFGLSVTAMAYGIGPISGCHINPAVSVGAWVAGRLPTSDFVGYVISQVLGAIAGAAVLYVIASGKTGGYVAATAGLGQTTYTDFSTLSAFLSEFFATFIFVVVILGATSKGGATPVAGLAIGLTLAICIATFVKVTGGSLNPARSIGPALFVGGAALSQIWLYILAPIAGAAAAGALFKSGQLEP